MTATEMAGTLASLIRNSEDDKVRLAAMKFFLDHTRHVMEYGRLSDTVARRDIATITRADGSKLVVERATHERRLVQSTRSETDLLLEEALNGGSYGGEDYIEGEISEDDPEAGDDDAGRHAPLPMGEGS